MAKHYPQTLWDAIRAYWENSNASYAEAAKAVSKGENIPSTPVIFKRKKKKIGKKKGNGEGNNKVMGVMVMKMRYLLSKPLMILTKV